MTPEQYRAAVARRRAQFCMWDEEVRYRIEERMGLLCGGEPGTRKRIVVIHEAMAEMGQLQWKGFI